MSSLSKLIPSLTNASLTVSTSNNLNLFEPWLYPVTSISYNVEVTLNPPNYTSNLMLDLFNQLSGVIQGFFSAVCLWSLNTCLNNP